MGLIICGMNGSGKSTLARLIMGIEKPSAGQILLDGTDITGSKSYTNEGYTLTPENITLTVGGESWEQWWFLGQVSEPDPELEMGRNSAMPCTSPSQIA